APKGSCTPLRSLTGGVSMARARFPPLSPTCLPLGGNSVIRAVEHVRLMRGGSQPHLIRADDDRYYVVKFLNNPQHPRVLANEWFAARIAGAIGLSVPRAEVMSISDDFVAGHPELIVRCGGTVHPCCTGPALASPIPGGTDARLPMYDYLPETGLEQVVNLHQFAGALALDKWLCNCDGRQVVFARPTPKAKMLVYFVDFGFCFNAGDWNFPDSPNRGVYQRDMVYRSVTGWDSFEPWLSRIEGFPRKRLLEIASEMPPEWEPNGGEQERLLAVLMARRQMVRGLIEAVRFSARKPFQNWAAARPATLQPATAAAIA